jgi:20S proteasome alpha/beta subunit
MVLDACNASLPSSEGYSLQFRPTEVSVRMGGVAYEEAGEAFVADLVGGEGEPDAAAGGVGGERACGAGLQLEGVTLGS